MRHSHWLGLIALVSLWGSSYLLIAIALRDFSPIFIVMVRQAMAILLLAPFVWRSRLTRYQLKWLCVVTLVMVTGPEVLLAIGQQWLPSSLAAILIATSPIFTAVMTLKFAAHEAIDRVQWLGIAAGMLGIIALFGIDMSSDTQTLFGACLIVITSAGYAAGGLIVRVKLTDVKATELAFGTNFISFVVMMPLLFASLPDQGPSLSPLAALIALGVFSTTASCLLCYWLIATIGAQRVALGHYLAPVIACLLGAVVLNEPLTVAAIGGMVMILSGSWLVSRTPQSRKVDHDEHSLVMLAPVNVLDDVQERHIGGDLV